MQYQEYLKDKTVAIVGSSSHLIGKSEGEFIDSHDVIVRTNNSSVIPPELHKDYGSRTDVGYFWHPIMRFSPHQDAISRNMKYAFMSEDRHVKPDIPTIRLRKDMAWLKDNGIPAYDMGYFQYLCYLECKVSPATGMIANYHLLRHPLKSLYVTGFSFHKTGTVEFSKEDTYRVSDNKEVMNRWKDGDYVGVNVNRLFDITEDEYYSGKRWFSRYMGEVIEKDGENFLILWDGGIEEICHHDSLRIGCHNSLMEEKTFFKWVANDTRIKLDDFLSSVHRTF